MPLRPQSAAIKQPFPTGGVGNSRTWYGKCPHSMAIAARVRTSRGTQAIQSFPCFSFLLALSSPKGVFATAAFEWVGVFGWAVSEKWSLKFGKPCPGNNVL